ncbi:MAG TPA: hypothetical protein PLP27_09260 [Crocinitomicaceae bacterium]|nr:hypothetical protein [Crocinitomicaceae bacterium]
MKTFLFICCTFAFGFAFSQKIDVKKDIVTVDGTPVFKLKYDMGQDIMYLHNLQDERLAIFKNEVYNDAKQITNGNPQGRVAYYDVTFLNDDLDKCEIDVAGFKKPLAKYLIEYKIMDGDKLNDVAVKKFVKIHGTKFSDQRNSSTTIIIQQR